MAEFLDLELGDIIGASGTVFKTKRGEVSVAITNFTLLATSIQPPPEKYHGLSDVETRYRQRYADLISNPEVADVFRKRSFCVRAMREFLDARGFLEVETPMMQTLAGGANGAALLSRITTLWILIYFYASRPNCISSAWLSAVWNAFTKSIVTFATKASTRATIPNLP